MTIMWIVRGIVIVIIASLIIAVGRRWWNKRQLKKEEEARRKKTKKEGDQENHAKPAEKSGDGCLWTAVKVLAALAGVWLMLGLGSCFWNGGRAFKAWMNKPRVYSVQASRPTPTVSTSEDPEWPSSGSAFLKKGGEAKAWLDPSSLHTMGSKPVDYTLEGHPSMTFHDDFTGHHDKKFRHFPAGRYIVTTDATEEVYFEWRPAH